MKNTATFLAFVVATCFLASLGSSATVTISGYVSDVLCYDKCITAAGCNKCALDKTDVLRKPWEHTLHCIRDVKVCVDSGYYVAANFPTGGVNDYRPRYRLDAKGNELAIQIIKLSSKHAGFQATIQGEDDGNNNLAVTSLVECSGNQTACDNSCTGCISTGWIQGGELSGLDHDLVVAHGSMLLTAWCFLAPIAFLFKRHQHSPMCHSPKATFFCYKDYPVFFLIHMFLMVTVWVLTLIAVSIALHNFKADGSRPEVGGHFYVGLIIFIFALWQPLPGFFCRPPVESPKRKYFNYVHKGVGYPLLVLGLLNCLTGALNYNRLWDQCEEGKRLGGAVLAGLIMMIVAAVSLEVIRQYYFCQGKADEHGHDAHGNLQKVESNPAVQLDSTEQA